MELRVLGATQETSHLCWAQFVMPLTVWLQPEERPFNEVVTRDVSLVIGGGLNGDPVQKRKSHRDPP